MNWDRKRYGDAEGPFGFPMRSDVANDIERLMAGLPEDVRSLGLKRIARVAEEVSFVDGERSDISYITTDSIDRDREVVDPAGGDWSQFRRNPVVTFAHRYDELPVGRAQWVRREKGADNARNGWRAKTEYISRPESWPAAEGWFPDAVWHMVQGGVLRGKSIGFIPTAAEPPTPDEIKARPQLAEARLIYRKWLALEYAVAPIPSTPDALVEEVARCKASGLNVETICSETGMIIPDALAPVEQERIEVRSAEPEAEPEPVVQTAPVVVPEPEKKSSIYILTAAERERIIAAEVARRIGELNASIPGRIADELRRLRGRV